MALTDDRRQAGSSSAAPKGVQEVASEIWQMSVAYAKQETVDPLRGLGRYLGYGVGGAIVLGIGVAMLLLAGLRALQTETGSTFTGNLSWVPYLIVLVVGAVFIGLAVWRVNHRKETGI